MKETRTGDSYCITLSRPSVTSSLKFASRSIAIAVPPALRQISNPSYELTKTSHLAISPQLFHSKLKTLLFKNPILVHPLLPTSLPVSTPKPSTIAFDCIPALLSGSDPLPIDFVLDKRLRIAWFQRLRFCGRYRKLDFTIAIHCSALW